MARMGDLIQTLPLIHTLARDRTVRLLCDTTVIEWARLLPGVGEIRSLDTRRWRFRATGDLSDFRQLIVALKDEITLLTGGISGDILPLNDHLTMNILTTGLATNQDCSWISRQLILVRSFLRLVASFHRLNRLHLSDVWRTLSNQQDSPSRCEGRTIPGIPILPLITQRIQVDQFSSSGTQFAQSVLESFKRRNIKQTWAVVLGSGAKCRRLEPEDFASWWALIPDAIRPGLVLMGGRGEEDLATRFIARAENRSQDLLNLVGACSPEELLAFFRKVDLVIGVDTGPLHWAAAVGARTLGFYFGEAGFHDTGPYGNAHLVLSPNCLEYPCHPARAEECGRRCRQSFRDQHAMVRFFSTLANDDLRAGIVPEGLRLQVSRLEIDGNHYRPYDGSSEPAYVTALMAIARRVLGLTTELGGESSQPLPPEQIRQVQQLCAAWENQIELVDFGVSVPLKIQNEVRRSASRWLQQQVKAFSLSLDAEYEDPTAERCLLSLEPANAGA
jgi:ADP-heptose:LPS heptosyltransferase